MRIRYHVVPRPDGGWQVLKEGTSRFSAQAATKKQALEKARWLALRHAPSQVLVHGRDGRIQDESTYGDDPFPPRG